MSSQAESVSLKRISENSRTPDKDEATLALAQLLARAARINQQFETNFDVTFSSMLLAFLTNEDALSQWFQGYVEKAEIAVDALLKTRRLDRNILAQIKAQPVNENEVAATWRQTASAQNLFAAARDFRSRTNAPLLDVRHLMGAYIYRPVGHEGDLVNLKYNRVGWSNEFLGQMAFHHPHELEEWSRLHLETFPDHPPQPLMAETVTASPDVNGPSTHIATDKWTLKDALGYHAYAYAISRFMTHKQTKAPLTISIQAPWGGGKTSLMRMIQDQLDPDALRETKQEAKQERGAFTVKQALNEIDNWIKQRTQQQLPTTPPDQECKLLTVWFNAWKYENVNQVWAGLADAIMHQVAARLPLAERERFWLLLNLKRIDADKLRQRIHERVLRYWWRALRTTVFVLGGTLIAGFLLAMIGSLLNASWIATTGWGSMLVSTLIGSLVSVLKFKQAKQTVNEEPAAISLNEYLDIPDYNKELGFIHHVEADLRRVLDSVPAHYKPIVIFIDDLDRCSPAKVAQVVEAVNLFLAGDFQNCMFVMGMDTEMVAAALQAAHKDMIANLPEDAGIPVGWRFMDKFVQLPFLIPPAIPTSVSRYTRALFSTDEVPLVDPVAEKLANEAAQRMTTRVTIDAKIFDEETERLRSEHTLDETTTAQLRRQLEAQVVQHRLNSGIENFNDRNQELQGVMAAAMTYFSGNPREMKRFVNAFRFHYFLWWAQRAQGLAAPSLEQLTRWTALAMKWPEVVRWLRRGGGQELIAAPEPAPDNTTRQMSFQSRLQLIESISGNATSLSMWQEKAKSDLRLAADKTSWLHDDDLLQFFQTEFRLPAGERLSGGAGQGLW